MKQALFPMYRKTLAPALFSAAVLGVATGAAQAADEVPLLSTQDPCAACSRPVPGSAPQSLPAMPAASAPQLSFHLNAVRLSGAQALGAADTADITAAYVGRDVTLGDLERMAQALTARYRERGFFLAQAVVPVQTVQDGVVEISVVEGRMGRIEVQVAADAPISEARVRAFLAPVEIGKAVNAATYERAMLLLSDQPGVKVSSGLQEGLQTGTTDLAVEVAAAPRYSLAADADNQGTRELGRYRAGVTARWLSPLGIGDNLDARLMVSDTNALQFGRLSYEAPVGSSGLRAGMGLGRINYELGGAFTALDARGTADVADVSLSYPVIRQRQQNLFLRLAADTKHLTDEFRSVAFESKKRSEGIGLGWTWEKRDDFFGGGYFASSGTVYRGRLKILDAQSLAFDQSIAGRNTDGSYAKFNFQLSRLQAVLPRHSVYVSVGAQRASGNLDPSEKLSLGGARAVRAYAGSEALVDEGQIGIVEWRWSYSDDLTPFVFYDAAHGQVARRPAPTDGNNGISLRGYGIGAAWSRPGLFSINATLAWRDGTRVPLTDGGDRSPRLYVQLQKVF